MEFLRDLFQRKMCLFIIFYLSSAYAKENHPRSEDMLQAEQDLRERHSAHISLKLANLLDELVYQWKSAPPFNQPSPTAVIEVSVPVGFGSGLSAELENHLFELLGKNKDTKIIPVHCRACLQTVAVAKQKETVIGKGADFPELMGDVNAKHFMYLDFSIEGAHYVLRAKMTDTSDERAITYAKTLSESTAAPSLLRSPDRLISPKEARNEYLKELQDTSFVKFPIRFGMRNFGDSKLVSKKDKQSLDLGVPSMPWLEFGIATALSQQRLWEVGAQVGYSNVPASHVGYSLGVRFARLMTGQAHSFLSPNLYLFTGMTYYSLDGITAAQFKNPDKKLTLKEYLAKELGGQGATVVTRYLGITLGLDLRLRNRFSVEAYLEYLPMNKTIEKKALFFQSMGVAMGVWF